MNFTSKKVFSFLLAAWAVLLLASCSAAERDWLSYRNGQGAFLLEGNREGEEFSCVLSYAEGELLSLCYQSPRALEGICVTKGSESGYRVERGSLAAELSEASLFGGLLLPAELFLLREARVLSVQSLQSGTLLTLSAPCAEGEITVTLAEGGVPLVIASELLTVRVLPIDG